MFGEYGVDGPRVPSPWDPFLPSPPAESTSPESRSYRSGLPKLAPEVEEGNVEYKLKLTNVTPARFARLVTQLKWRLLEGGGQAYYELGVADSGALIGLTRPDLEESLETLEMMAGEIGASIIVVKEIEVPSIMVALADKASGYLDPETGKWANKMSTKHSRTMLRDDAEFLSTTPVMTETETEISIAELTDSEDAASSFSTTLVTPAESRRASPHPATLPFSQRRLLTSNPNRPSAQSSPAIFPIDDDLALFSMEPEPSHRDTEDELESNELSFDEEVFEFSVDLEISSVYKPRPFRKRQHNFTNFTQGGRRTHKGKEKKQQPWHPIPRSYLSSVQSIHLGSGCDDSGASLSPLTKQETKALHRRQARNKRKEERRKTLITAVGTANGSASEESGSSLDSPSTSLRQRVEVETEDLVSGLQSLHVTLRTAPDNVGSQEPDVTFTEDITTTAKEEYGVSGLGDGKPMPVKEPRLIVEALVVRKQSIDEGFLDFSGFSLI